MRASDAQLQALELRRASAVALGGEDDVSGEDPCGSLGLALAPAPNFEALAQTIGSVLGSVGAEGLPRAIVDATERLLLADDVTLFLPSSETELYVAHASGLTAAVKANARIRIGEGIGGRVAASRRAEVLNSDLGEQRGYEENATRRVRSSIIQPIVLGPDLLGLLTVSRHEDAPAFNERDLERAGMFATESAFALRNAALVQRLVGTERLVAVGQLASGIAHEVNNPVACILANLEFVLDELASGEVLDEERLAEHRQALRDSIESARRIRDVVGELRRFSTTRGAPTDRVDVGATLREAVQLTLPRTRARGPITIVQGQDASIVGEGPRLLQVLVSAILHVHAHADEAGPDAALVLTVSHQGARVQIDVSGPESLTVESSGVLGGIFAIEGDQNALGGLAVGLYAARDLVRGWGGDLVERRALGRFHVTVTIPATTGHAS